MNDEIPIIKQIPLINNVTGQEITNDKNKINVDDYIHFTTSLDSFKSRNVANNIFKQIISVYNQSALKKYNDSINFTPSISYGNKEGFAIPSYTISLSNKLAIWGVTEPAFYYLDTNWEDLIQHMRQTMGVDDSEFKDSESIKNQSIDSQRFDDLDVKELEAKMKHVPITCIPKFTFIGKVVSSLDSNIINKNNPKDNNHILYTKSDLLDDLNEFGLFLLSESNKSPQVNLAKTPLIPLIFKRILGG